MNVYHDFTTTARSLRSVSQLGYTEIVVARHNCYSNSFAFTERTMRATSCNGTMTLMAT